MIWKLAVSALVSVFLYDQGPPLAKNGPQQESAAQSDPAADQQQGAAAEKSGSAATDPTDLKLLDVEKQIVEQTNTQRVKYGLPALVVDRSLEKTARTHAAWMTNNRSLQHTSLNVGENIAMGQRTTDEAVSDWMASPGHRANILRGSFKRTGVAAYRTSDGTIYWCQQFLP